MNKLTLNLSIVFAICSAIFIAYPNIDIAVSSAFYDGTTFNNRDHWVPKIFYYLIRIIAVATTLWSIGGLLLNHFRPNFKHKYLPKGKRYFAFILIALLLGPGLIVHQGFKDYFERARPVNIEEFGGKKTYTAPYVVSNQKGKSFISGHAAMGFFVCAFAFLAHGKKRTQLYVYGLIFGTLASSMRVIQGGHFLSDVVLGGLVTLLTIQLVYTFAIRQTNEQTP